MSKKGRGQNSHKLMLRKDVGVDDWVAHKKGMETKNVCPSTSWPKTVQSKAILSIYEWIESNIRLMSSL